MVDLPDGKNVIGCKWIYKIKRNADGDVSIYKARLVAQGYSQVEGMDYEEVFAPVARYNSIQSILAIANELDSVLGYPRTQVVLCLITCVLCVIINQHYNEITIGLV